MNTFAVLFDFDHAYIYFLVSVSVLKVIGFLFSLFIFYGARGNLLVFVSFLVYFREFYSSFETIFIRLEKYMTCIIHNIHFVSLEKYM